MSDKPDTVLPRHTLATAVHGTHVIRSQASHAARAITYEGHLGTCLDGDVRIDSWYHPRWEEDGSVGSAQSVRKISRKFMLHGARFVGRTLHQRFLFLIVGTTCSL